MKISVIIPTLNEADQLPDVLWRLSKADQSVEVIVSDGGSTDDTCRIAQSWGAQLVEGACGRGQQLIRGVKAASGDALLFLHADTKLPLNAITQILQTLEDTNIIGGNFELKFDGGTEFASWLNGYYAWLRSNGFYYGDSAIFVRRDVYDVIGGIRPISLMEDYDFVRRMERAGQTACLNSPGAVTSSRRFQDRKPWRIYWQWLYLHALFHLRVPSDVLAWLYRSKRHSPAADEPKHIKSDKSALGY